MSHPKRAISPARHPSNKGLARPEPPEDLWERLDDAVQEHCRVVYTPPPNSFTSADYAAERHISTKTAADRLLVLFKKGAISRTKCGHATYYFFATDSQIKKEAKNGR